jgi:hypothetical protein
VKKRGFVVLGILGVLGALAIGVSVVSGATFQDPAGDNCKLFGGISFCGFDISGAASSVDTAGAVHLSVTYADANCVGNTLNNHNMPAFEIHPAGTATPTFLNLSGLIQSQAGGLGYSIRYGATPALPLTANVTATTTAVGGQTTLEVAIPKAVAATFGPSFGWLASNTCIGELPNEASDVIPNTGLLAFGGGSSVTGSSAQTAVAGALAKTKPGGAAAMLSAGGFNTTFNAPGAGTLTVLLTAPATGAASLGAAKPVVLARLSAKLTAAGKVTKKVKLTAAGRTRLRNAKTAVKAKLTVTFLAGSVKRSVSRKVSIAPKSHARSGGSGGVIVYG